MLEFNIDLNDCILCYRHHVDMLDWLHAFDSSIAWCCWNESPDDLISITGHHHALHILVFHSRIGFLHMNSKMHPRDLSCYHHLLQCMEHLPDPICCFKQETYKKRLAVGIFNSLEAGKLSYFALPLFFSVSLALYSHLSLFSAIWLSGLII